MPNTTGRSLSDNEFRTAFKTMFGLAQSDSKASACIEQLEAAGVTLPYGLTSNTAIVYPRTKVLSRLWSLTRKDDLYGIISEMESGEFALIPDASEALHGFRALMLLAVFRGAPRDVAGSIASTIHAWYTLSPDQSAVRCVTGSIGDTHVCAVQLHTIV